MKPRHEATVALFTNQTALDMVKLQTGTISFLRSITCSSTVNVHGWSKFDWVGGVKIEIITEQMASAENLARANAGLTCQDGWEDSTSIRAS
jgi:hypothetical protein